MRRTAALVLVILGFAILIGAQTKPPVTPADYGQFETLAPSGPTGGLSPDGKWLAYGINRSNRNNELRITNIADGTTKVTAFGTQPVFSSDSNWVAFAVVNSEAQDEKLRQQKKPIQRKMGLLNLSTEDQTVVDAIETFSFSPNGTYLAMRKYAPEKKDAPNTSTDAAAAADRVFSTELRLAGHLAELAVLADPSDPGVRRIHSEVFSLMATVATSTMAKGIYRWAASESDS